MSDNRNNRRDDRSGGKKPGRGQGGRGSGSSGSGRSSDGSPKRGSDRSYGKSGGGSGRSSDSSSRGGSGRSQDKSGSGRSSDRSGRSGKSFDKPSSEKPRPRQREQLRTAADGDGDLPRWVREEIQRSTPKEKRDAALALVGEAASEFADGRYPAAYARLLQAKQLSTRAATIRELLGLSAYRMGNWSDALQELRAYRRIEGDTTHLAVEMDCLRAMGRHDDIPKVWEIFQERGGSKAAEVELRVVYGAHLLDLDQAREAWSIAKPGRITADAHENDLRQWYVAARAALALGDVATARQLLDAIERRDVAFPGLEELTEQINRAE